MKIHRKIFLSITLFMGISLLHAQPGPSYFALRTGLSIPFGKFSNYNLQESSFTTTGISISGDGAWFFLPYLGVGGEFDYNLQPIDVGVLGYEKVLADPALEDVTIRSEGFQTLTTGVGLYSEWNFWKSFSLSGKLLGGWIWAKTPYQLYKPVYFMIGAADWYEITSAKDNGFIIIPGIGLQHKFSHCIALKAEGELYYRNMQFGYSRFGEVYYIDRRVSFINVTLGLVVLL